MSQRLIRRPVAFLAGVALLGVACTQATTKQAASTTAAAPGSVRTITVLAAASLTEVFDEIGKAFEAANPTVAVKFTYDGAAALETRANSGAPADVFAPPDDASMLKVTAAGHAPRPQTFVRDALEIIVAKGNPKGIRTLVDFNRADVVYALCAAAGPCGTYGKQVLDQAGVTRPAASSGESSRGVVDKVMSGRADAGIVYTTDATAAAVEGVAIPDEENRVVAYPIAVLTQSAQPELARAFVDYLLSPPGQAALAKYGFRPVK